MKLFDPRSRRPASESGFVLLLIVLSMLAIAATLFFAGVGTSIERSTARSASVDQQLKNGRDALLGYAIGTFGGGARPGQLPTPDSLQNNKYDGVSDTGCLDSGAVNGLPALSGAAARSANLRCIGRLPWKTLGLQVDTPDEFDALGIVPWYSASANLADPNSCLQYLNSGIVALPAISFVCPSPLAPPFPWLKVCDESGRLLSDRVAIVLIYPGAPLATQGRTQSRAGSPRPQPADFLDAIPVPAGWGSLPVGQRCSTYVNAALTNEFVIASASNAFNDRLIYVTIDELMGEVEKRVAVELREAVRSFRQSRGAYPWLVPLTDPTLAAANLAIPTTLSGFVPYHTTDASNTFLSELGWTIPSGATTSPASSSPTFNCFGGFTCRLRTTAGGAIPNSVTIANVNALASFDLTTPVATCKWTTNGNTEVKCSHTFVTSAAAQTYRLELNFGIWLNLGNINGTQSRTVTVDFNSVVGAAGTPVVATGTNVFQRSVVASALTLGLLSVRDTFLDSSATMPAAEQVGFGETTGGVGTTTVRSIRAYPVLPAWYFAEKWYEYSFAALSPDASPTLGGASCSASCFTSGVRGSLDLIVAATGAPLAGQIRNQATPPLAAFFEDLNATGLTPGITYGKFNAVGSPKSSIYNDSIATLPP